MESGGRGQRSVVGVKHLLWGGWGHRKVKDMGEPQDAGELGVPEEKKGQGQNLKRS